MPDLRRHADAYALAAAAAEALATRIRDHQGTQPFRLVLAGGSTPRPLYECLAADYADLPWDRVRLFWSDERYVPYDREASNYRLAHETLITPLGLSDDQLFPMPTDADDPADAAWTYESRLRNALPSSPEAALFDVTLLGMGDDGHTASLFPGSDVLEETRRWVRAIEAPAYMDPRTRLTLTYPALNRSREVFFLVAGVQKRDALAQVLEGPSGSDDALPAARISAERILWWVDEAAAPVSAS